MLCILKVSGSNLAVDEIAEATGLKPYRIDPTCLHYEVAEVESDDWHALASQIAAFLSAQERGLLELERMESIVDKRLDVAVFFRMDQVMKTLELGTAILAQTVRLGLALEFSIYSTEASAV